MPFRSRSILARLARLAPVVLVALALAGAPGRDAAVSAGKLDPLAVATALGAGRASVIVRLVAQADVSAAYRLPGKQARGRFVFERLRSVAERTQPPVVAWLARRGATTRPLFIVNALALEADADTLRALAARPDVAAVRLDGSVSLPEPDAPALHGPPALSSNDSQPPAASVTALAAVEAGVRAIHADAVWRRGYRGQGIVVAITDTGAAFEHPALEDNYRGRVDGHDYSWYDAISGLAEPVDEANHGTHVTGTAVGKAGSRQIGVAPDAEWIACRLIEEREGPDSASLACLQWALAPTRVDRTDPRPDLAPDVVNASWGGKPGDECAGIPEIAEAVSNLTAAGILFVSSAGNDGDDCGTMCAPATYPASLAVANYDVTHRRIAASSSRGPVQSDIGEIVKPDVAAPGTDINSSLPPTKYGELSGTSMAAPHVTGAAALLLSARPDLRGRPEIVRRILEESADRIAPDRCGPRGDEPMTNHAGYGLIDVDKAVVAALTATPEPTGTSTPTSTATPPHSPTPPATTSPTPTATPLATVTPDVPPTPTDVPRTNVYLPVARRG